MSKTNIKRRSKEPTNVFLYEALIVFCLLSLIPLFQVLQPNQIQTNLTQEIDKSYKLIFTFLASFSVDWMYCHSRGKNGKTPLVRSHHHGILVSHMAILLIFFSHSVALHSPHNPWADLFDYLFYFSLFSLLIDLQQRLLDQHILLQAIPTLLFLFLDFSHANYLMLGSLLFWLFSPKLFPHSFTTGESWMVAASIMLLIKDNKMNLGVEIYLLKALVIGTLSLALTLHFLVPGPFLTPSRAAFHIFRFIAGAVLFVLPWLNNRFPVHPLRW